jgi:hypothetical protein
MDKRKKKFFILLLALIPAILSGQIREKQAGIRSGYSGGLFYQVTNESGNAFTGYMAMLGFRNNGMQLTGLKIIYEMPLDDISPDLYFSWGYGAHAGFSITDHTRFLGNTYWYRNERFLPLFGVDAWGSAEYRFRSVPVAVSLNIKPFIELTFPSFINLMPGDLGISVSYTF